MSHLTGELALDRVLAGLSAPARILDVGAGPGKHARRFLDAGHQVTAVDIRPAAFEHPSLSWVRGDFMAIAPYLGPHDVVWCSHVLEHLHDVGAALSRLRRCLPKRGILAVTVPPRKDALVGGHVSLWTPALLVYRLILAGFDCRAAAVKTYGYNVSAILSAWPAVPPDVLESLVHDNGDIETLAPYFPWPVYQGIDGFLLPGVNW